MSRYFDYHEIDQLLQSHITMRYDFVHHENYNDLIQKLLRVPKELVLKVFDGAFLFSQVAGDEVNESVINKIIDCLNEYDIQSLTNYGEALDEFVSVGMKTELYELLSKQINTELMKRSNKVNAEIVDISLSFLNNADRLVNTFSVLKKSMKIELLNEIFLNCSKRMKSFWQKVENQNFQEIVNTLTEGFGEDSFTEQELIELSQKCATVFCDSSKDKILGIDKILSDYKNYCVMLASSTPEFDKDEFEKLKEFNVRQIFRTTASITKANNRTVYHTSEFLKGKTIGEIFDHKIQSNDIKSKLYQKFKDAKINLSCEDLVWVITKNPTLLSSSITSTLEFLEKIEKSFKSIYQDDSDFNVSELLTRNNVLRGMPKNVDPENINKNIELLSCFMSKNDIVSYLQEDMNIFSVDNKKLNNIVIKIFTQNTSVEKLNKDLNAVLKGEIAELMIKESVQKEGTKHSIKVKKENKIEYLVPDVKADFEKIKDFVFDFDLKKLKILLGNHYDIFIDGFKKSGVNSDKVQDVIDRQPSSFIRPDSKDSINVSTLKKFINSGYGGDKFNKNELLWQLYRNIISATEIIEKTFDETNADKKAHKLFICSANYDKLSREFDLVFKQMDNINEHYKKSISGIATKTISAFEEMTDKFAKLCNGNEQFLIERDEELKREQQQLEKEIDDLVVDGDFGQFINNEKSRLLAELERKNAEYKKYQDKLDMQKKIIISTRLELHKEKNKEVNNSEINYENDLNENCNFLPLVYSSDDERKLYKELEDQQKDRTLYEGIVRSYIFEISKIKKKLSEIKRKNSRLDIAEALEERLKFIERELKHIEEIRNKINKSENDDEKK